MQLEHRRNALIEPQTRQLLPFSADPEVAEFVEEDDVVVDIETDVCGCLLLGLRMLFLRCVLFMLARESEKITQEAIVSQTCAQVNMLYVFCCVFAGKQHNKRDFSTPIVRFAFEPKSVQIFSELFSLFVQISNECHFGLVCWCLDQIITFFPRKCRPHGRLIMRNLFVDVIDGG